MSTQDVVWAITVVVMCAILIGGCIGVCLYIHHQDQDYMDAHGSVDAHHAHMQALGDAVEKEGLWY